MCPPVPPPAISRRIVPGSSFDGFAADREQDAHGSEADQERRAAGAYKRKRDARDREQRHDDPDVDERLATEPRGDARREQRAKRIRCRERDPDSLVRKHAEERDHQPRSEEPELLADARESQIVAGVGEEQAARQAALAETGTGDAAEPEREQALDRMETRAQRVAPGIEPGP